MSTRGEHARNVPLGALGLGFALIAASGVFAEALILPSWTSLAESPISFTAGRSIDPDETAVKLFGFPGLARGISVAGERISIRAFELAPPSGAAFIKPQNPLPGYEPIPVFRELQIGPESRGPYSADCHYVSTSDPFGGVFEEGGARLAWDGWELTAWRLELASDGLRATGGFVSNLREERSAGRAQDLGAYISVVAELVELHFDKTWELQPTPGSIINPWVVMPGLGLVAIGTIELTSETGVLAASIGAREAETDEWIDAAPFKKAIVDGHGSVTSSVPRDETAKFGQEGAFSIEFAAESAGVPMIGSGLIRLPETLGGGEYRSSPGAVTAWAGSYWEGENYFEVSSFEEPLRVTYGPWSLNLHPASIGRAGDMKHIWALLAPSATALWRETPIPLRSIALSSEGLLLEEDYCSGELRLPIFGGRFLAYRWLLEEDAISVDGAIELPSEFDEGLIRIDSLELYPDGTFRQSSAFHTRLSSRAGTFILESVYLDGRGFRASEAEFWPNWTAIAGPLRFNDFLLGNDGELEAKGPDFFEVGGFHILPLGDMSIQDGCLQIYGKVEAPETMPYGLRSVGTDIACILFPLDGSAPSFESTFEFEHQALYRDIGWFSVSRRSIVISDDFSGMRLDGLKPQLASNGFEEAPEFALDGVRVSTDGIWDFSQATFAEPVLFELDGIAIALNRLVRVSERGFLLSGKATWMGSDGEIESHGCAIDIAFGGKLSAVIAEGDTLRWIRK